MALWNTLNSQSMVIMSGKRNQSMTDHGLRTMAKVFGGIPSIGDLVGPLGKDKHVVLLKCIMMKDVLPKFLIKNGIYMMAIIGIMLETNLKYDVVTNPKVIHQIFCSNGRPVEFY